MSPDGIIDICEEAFSDAKSDCSLFVRQVCARLGVILAGNADAIVDQIRGDGWTLLGDGADAKRAADEGQLVIGGLKGAEQVEIDAHGHVVIVVTGPLAHDKYPSAYWGKLGGVGARNRTINWAWRAIDRDRVTYCARKV